MATNFAFRALSEPRSASTKESIAGNIEKTDRSISQFFRPKPKPISHGTSRSHVQEKNTLIILDDDSDDELDDGKNDIVNFTGGQASVSSLNRRSEILELHDDDEHDAQRSLLPEKRNRRKCEKDIVHDDSRQCDLGVRHYHLQQDYATNNNDVYSSPEKFSPRVENNKKNPFAKFAHVKPVVAESLRLKNEKTISHPLSISPRNKKRRNSTAKTNGDNFSASRLTKISTSLLHEKKKEKEFIKICDTSPQEQIKITRKWHSMADPSAPLEVRRFQILVAARLHARCQEITVRKAMQKLREHFSSRSETNTITVNDIAKSDPEDLAVHLSNLQFYNAKAKQIVKAAQQIQSRHGGIVPEDECSLLQISGIGKTFADLLAFVNKRETHERLNSSS